MNKSLFMLATMITMVAGIWAQTTEVSIGNGGCGYCSEFPTHLYFNNTASQMIYLENEINQVGNITTISFKNNYAGLDTTRNIKLYLATTLLNQFSFLSDALPISDFTLVYEGPWHIVGGQWSQIQLNTPFLYDGTSNLVIGMEDNTGNYIGGGVYWQASTGTKRCIGTRNDNLAVSMSNLTGGSIVDYYPDVKLTIAEVESFCAGVYIILRFPTLHLLLLLFLGRQEKKALPLFIR